MFSLDQFYQLNRRLIIWIALLGLLWLMRDFFGLIFLTFVLAFLSAPLAAFVQRRLHLGRRSAIVAVFMLFLGLLIAFFVFVTPGILAESRTLLTDLGNIQRRVLEARARVLSDLPAVNTALTGYIRSHLPEKALENPRLVAAEQELHELETSIERLTPRGNRAPGAVQTEVESAPLTGDTRLSGEPLLAETDSSGTTYAAPGMVPPAPAGSQLTPEQEQTRVDLHRRAIALRGEMDELLIMLYLSDRGQSLAENVPKLIPRLWDALLTLLVALLFSFLIMMDVPRLERLVRSLSHSRLHDFYEQAAQPVVRFAYVVGRAIQAQAMIACVNTVLTLCGLLVLGIPSIAMLSVIVFVCSFIPVLGVFISTLPIVLVGLNSGGLETAVGAVVMVVVIHAIEAYMLNPLIYGRHLKLNPVLVLIILFIGHHAFGLWGMLLGVPVAHYFLHDVFGVPVWDERRLAPSEKAKQRADARNSAAAIPPVIKPPTPPPGD